MWDLDKTVFVNIHTGFENIASKRSKSLRVIYKFITDQNGLENSLKYFTLELLEARRAAINISLRKSCWSYEIEIYQFLSGPMMSRKERLQTLNCHSKSYLDYDQLYSLNEKLIFTRRRRLLRSASAGSIFDCVQELIGESKCFQHIFQHAYVNATLRVLGLMTYSYLTPGVIP